MNQTPPLAVPLLPRPIRARKPPAAIPGRACPAPHSLPLPGAVPHPVRLPPFAPARPALFFALALSISALGIDCAQLDLTSSADAGSAPTPAGVSSVEPAAGAIPADSSFEVDFATPMDASLLLSDIARSETVVLVAQSDAQVMAAALAHARLTAAEEALIIPAQATLSAQALSITLAPDAPLAAGTYALLVASRLKDASGQKLPGTGYEFDYSVAAAPPVPALVDPPAGSSAPANLARVRVSFPAGASGSIVSLVGPSGLVAAAAAPASAGEVAIELCADAPCAALLAGQSYSLALDGTGVAGASFTAAMCSRDDGPSLLTSTVAPRDTSAQLAVSLDWPARVFARLSLGTATDAGSPPDAGSTDASCDGPDCSLSLFVDCATSGCASETGGACAASLEFTSLAAATLYTAQLWLEDDEGNLSSTPPLAFSTLSPLPSASLVEIMAAPPLPAPRDQGEYVALQNTGSGALDLSQLALQGPDGIVRPLQAGAPSTLLLEPGGYALAVGASFNAARYAIPASVPVLRAKTQRLLGRGLADASPPAMALVATGTDAGSALIISSFPGGPFHCPDGASIDRVEPAPDAGAPTFACGADGGMF